MYRKQIVKEYLQSPSQKLRFGPGGKCCACCCKFPYKNRKRKPLMNRMFRRTLPRIVIEVENE